MPSWSLGTGEGFRDQSFMPQNLHLVPKLELGNQVGSED